MTRLSEESLRLDRLRSRAVATLKGPAAPAPEAASASAALGVLYDLASSASTAPNALTLLHELQVHQVEVELQDEELRRSRLELEASLGRYAQLFDCAPVGYLTVDRHAALRELNNMGARMLGAEPEMLRGRALDSFLTLESKATLAALLARIIGGAGPGHADLGLRTTTDGAPRRLHVSACADPAGDGFLVAIIEVAAATPSPR